MSAALDYAPVLLPHPGRTTPVSLEEYRAEDGYAGWRKALTTMTPDEKPADRDIDSEADALRQLREQRRPAATAGAALLPQGHAASSAAASTLPLAWRWTTTKSGSKYSTRAGAS